MAHKNKGNVIISKEWWDKNERTDNKERKKRKTKQTNKQTEMILLRGLCVLRSCSMSLVFYFYIYLSIYLSLLYLEREGGGVVFQTVVSAEPGEHLISNPEWSAAGRNKTTNLKRGGKRERTRDIENVKRAPRIYGGGVVGGIKFSTKPRAHHQQDNPHTHKPQTPPLPSNHHVYYIHLGLLLFDFCFAFRNSL